jgi:hypothetical protein
MSERVAFHLFWHLVILGIFAMFFGRAMLDLISTL